MPAFRTSGQVGPQGESAYQVAVANGFVGSEADWLNSLIGAQGAPGETVVTVNQSSPATDWLVTHNLGRRPAAISVYDTANTQILGSYEDVDDDSFLLHFSAAFAGRTEVF